MQAIRGVVRVMRVTGISKFLTVLVLTLGLAACATGPRTDAEVNDPLEDVNRVIFDVNLALDKVLVRPAAFFYGELPGGVKDGIRNFLRNLKTPVILANNLLQGDVQGASDTIGRFLTNTIMGLGGVFDVANGNGKGIAYRSEDFGQTLAVWGFSDGPYLMLPLLGPSNVRDGLGMIPDYFLDPINWWDMNTDSDTPAYIGIGGRVLSVVDTRSRNVKQLEDLEATSLDFYATVRSLYRQQRENMINNSDEAEGTPIPSVNFEIEEDEDANNKAALVQ